MIGWKVDVGYAFTTEPKTLSDISFTDFDVPFGIPVLSGPPISKKRIFAGDGNGLFDALSSYLGDQVNSIWSYFANEPSDINNAKLVDFLATVFPSMKSWAPLLYESFLAWANNEFGYVTFVPYIYFKQTKRIAQLCYSHTFTSSNNQRVFSVDNNGNLENVYTTDGGHPRLFFPWASGHVLEVAVLTEYVKGKTDYRLYSSYQPRYFQIYYFGGSKNPFALDTTNLSSSAFDQYMTALFPTLIEPDFDVLPPPQPVDPDNPYKPGGESGPGNLPPGTFDNTSDAIPDSTLPTLSSADTGFTRIYNPTLAQVQNLARYLWTDETVIETIWNKIRQFFENPMEAIIGFNLVPVPVPDGGTKNFALMYIDTGVQMTAAASQFVDQDCGSVKLERYYGSALDQSPYTKVSCFLPYIGTVQLNTDEVMGTTLSVKYRVDIASGSCVAKILVDGNVLYQYSGHCAIPIPFSSADFTQYVSSAISVAKLAVGAATAGAAGAIGASMTDPSQETGRTVTKTTDTRETERNPQTGRQITTGTMHSVTTTHYPPKDKSGTQASFSGLSPANVANTVGQIMASKPNVEHSGSFSGNSGYLGIRRPYLIIERPNMCMPQYYQSLNGFPSMIFLWLGDCVGYTRVQQVQLTGCTATNPEQAEILSLLKSGVVL